MKRLISLSLIMMFVVGTTVFGDNTARVTELQEEAKTLIQRRAEYVKVINNIDIRLLQINAVIEELKRQDLESTRKVEEDK